MSCGALAAPLPPRKALGRVSIEQASGSNAWVLGSKREAALKRGDLASRRGRGRAAHSATSGATLSSLHRVCTGVIHFHSIHI